MDLIVCVKQVPDPEAPAASFRIDPVANKVLPMEGTPPVISPFDEQAVEAALQIKDQQGGKVTVISLGPPSARDVIKHALAMGADEGVLLTDPAFENSDSFATATALAAAIRKIGPWDAIFCGRQAADWDNGQVGSGIAELLGVPSATIAKKVDAVDGRLRVERVLADGYEVVEVPTPCVVTISNEIGQPRYPTLRGIMAAAKKQVSTWSAADIGLDASQVGSAGSKNRLLKLFIPVREGTCQIVEGETVAEAAVALALKLREAKII